MIEAVTVRALVRQLLSLLGMGLYHAGLAPLIIWINRRTPKVLLYHACEPLESDFIRGLNSNTVPVAFARQLDFLDERYQVIPLAQLEEGPIPDRAVVITFDDGYRSVFEAAFPLLRARDMPATLYLVTDVVDNRELVWVNALNWLLYRHPGLCIPIAHRELRVPINRRIPPEIVAFAKAHYDATTVSTALASMWRAVGIDPGAFATEAGLYLTTAEIREMITGGLTFGSHTAHHPNLRCLDETQQRSECEAAFQFLDAIGGRRSLAYPFGEFNHYSRRVAAALGHRSVMEVGGVNKPLDLLAVARVPVTASSRAAFFAEMEVVAPIMALAKRLASQAIHEA